MFALLSCSKINTHLLPFIGLVFSAGFCLTLGACATGTQAKKAPPPTKTNGEAFRDAMSDTRKSLPSVAKAPLQDFNLMKEEIPAILTAIEYPYKIDGPVYCDVLAQEVKALDEVLGMGMDHIREDLANNEKAAEAATNAATSALEDAATGWLPYRSVIRRLTGATKHERAIRNAYQRGRIRRAFLKGVGGAFQCPYPARPSSVEQPILARDQ